MTLRILILAHSLNGQGGLIGGQNFIRQLKLVRPNHRYLITIPSNCGYEKIQIPANSQFYKLPLETPIYKRIYFEKVVLPKIINDFKTDALLGLGNHGVLGVDCPQVIWVRNGYLAYPSENFPQARLKTKIHVFLQRLYFKKVLIKSNPIILCQTPVMRKRISEYYNYPDQCMGILPNALSEMLKGTNKKRHPLSSQVIIKSKFNCFMPSRYYIHKNPNIILDACLRFREKLNDFRFITTISKDDCPDAKWFIKSIEKNNLQDMIVNVGKISHAELDRYYNSIQLVVLPTLMESFSITYLEAMYYKVPILTTDLDFANYLCGGAALYYNPRDISDFVNQLLVLKQNNRLREQLTAAGQEQIKHFSSDWSNVVNTAFDILEKHQKKIYATKF